MNAHGQHAMETMRNHDPETFGQIQNPEEYFSILGFWISEQIEDVMDGLIIRNTMGKSTLDILGEQNMARFRAREIVYQEMIYSSLPRNRKSWTTARCRTRTRTRSNRRTDTGTAATSTGPAETRPVVPAGQPG